MSFANQAARASAEVIIDVMAGVDAQTSGTSASYIMGRYWNVNNANGIDEPVNIRFYYDPNELTEASTQASNYASANGLSDNGFMWFKQATAFDPSTDNNPNFAPDLTLTAALAGTDNGVNYMQFDGITSFSGGGGMASAATTFPIELLSFTAEALPFANELKWQTGIQYNFSHFEVERSVEGNLFNSFGRLNNAGNQEEREEYRFLDERPLNPEGINYYRLKMVDLDGSFEYSEVISVLRTDYLEHRVLVYPNPAEDLLFVDYNLLHEHELSFTLTTAIGNIVRKGNMDTRTEAQLNLTELPAGIYLLHLKNDYINQSFRIVKK